MLRIMFYVATIIITLHGLIHLLGFVAYWPLAEISEIPYKTTLLNGRLDVGQKGMRLYSTLWLVTAVALVIATVGLVVEQNWWLPLMGIAAALSLIITVLDWHNAFRGAFLTLLILLPVILAWGLRVQPRPFAPYPQSTQSLATIALPADLPAPVARYYQTVLGDEIPVVETAVVTARGQLRFKGITFPDRLRFTYQAGQGYRHYIEATLFGRPLMKVNEWYLDGRARLELPVGVVENEPKVDMAANLGLWGETIWFPSIFVTDPRVRWEAVDAHSAQLIVPFKNSEDTFTVFFDRESGLIDRMEAMRYRDAADTEKILWELTPLEWAEYDGMLIPARSSVTWADEGTPWLIIDIDNIVYNVDVDSYIRAAGP